MFRFSHLRFGAGVCAVAATALLCACAGERELPTGEPSFYRSLATKDAQVDAAVAASMISGYRTNNGLTPVTIDPELMKLAEAQAQAMASRDTLSHDVARSFHDRLKGGGYRAHRGGECRRRLPHSGASLLRLARFAAAPRQYAAQGRDPHGHRRGLFAEIQMQGVLGAHLGGARGAARLNLLFASSGRGAHAAAVRSSSAGPKVCRASLSSGATAAANASCSAAASSTISQPCATIAWRACSSSSTCSSR